MPAPFDPQPLIDQLADTLTDARLSDDEKRGLVAALREASPPEEGLRQLRNQAFALARSQVAQPGADAAATLKWLEGIVRALDSGRAPDGIALRTYAVFSPGTDCLAAIQRQLRSARQRLDLCVFTISDDRITQDILDAHRRGVAVRLVTDNEKEHDAGSDIARLRSAGIATVVDRSSAHMHHKFALVDGHWLLNGSYNWTRSACEFNEENLVVSNEPGLVAAFAQRFETLWRALSSDPAHGLRETRPPTS